ncbi:MAG TPA: ArsR family transcriptional regulator [Phycisphaerae bacterium]|nr:ArsR family transcriptional regulator [Phycisphaerae bacterium]
MCRKLRLPQPTVSHHLGLLRAHGLVKNRRAGKQVFYSVDPTRFNRIATVASGLFAVA